MIDADGTSRKRVLSRFFCFRISKGDGDIPAVTNEEMC